MNFTIDKTAEKEKWLRNYLTRVITDSDIFCFSIINTSPMADIAITITEMDKSVKRTCHTLFHAASNPHGKLLLFTEVEWLNQSWVIIIYSLTKINEEQMQRFKTDLLDILSVGYWFDSIKTFGKK
jgi:hypothetical protein